MKNTRQAHTFPLFPADLICVEQNQSLEIKDNKRTRLERMEKRFVGAHVLLNVPADGQTGRFHIETWIPSQLFS